MTLGSLVIIICDQYYQRSQSLASKIVNHITHSSDLNFRKSHNIMLKFIDNHLRPIFLLQLIESMRVLNRLRYPLTHQNIYQYSLLNKTPKQYNLVYDNPPLQYWSVDRLHKLILHSGRMELVPIYLRYYHKFSHPGINRKTNYYLLVKNINFLTRKLSMEAPAVEAAKQYANWQQKQVPPTSATEEPHKEQPKEEQDDNSQKLKTTAVIISLVFGMLLLLQAFNKKEAKKASTQAPLPMMNINEDTLVSKLMENLKDVRIKEKQENKACNYTVTFEYQDGSSQKFKYIGNINNLVAMIESHEKDKFQKVKIHFDKEQYSFLSTFTDALSLLVPFIGIAITIFIFKKFTPDSLMSKLSPKKNYKIQGMRDIKVKFEDVAGMEQAKRQITQFVDFLKHSEKYRSIGAKIPKGALLTGPPGTGKTMLAKATAGEAGVPFFYISGSEMVEIFVGMGAAKVRELFSRARMEAPSIIFIDEIDAIGRKRQSSRNEEKDSTLNQLLVQMDGFGSHETVIILAATNRKDTLDNALTRPGRFDRMVEVTLPEIQARQQIFKVHLKPLKVDPNKPLSQIAKRLAELTPGFSGADIANLCNEAAIIAIRRGKTYVEEKDFEDASERITAGYEKKGLARPQTRKRVAYHQAGHAICGWFLKGGDPLVKLTIIPRSKGALGYAQYLPKSNYIITKSDLIDRIAIMLGGITSEQMHFDHVSSGASDDLQKVYQLSRGMVTQYGMGKNTYNVTVDDQSYVRKESQSLAGEMDQQMLEIVKEAQKRCRDVLTQNRQVMDKLAETLLEKQTINSEDIKSILGERPKFA